MGESDVLAPAIEALGLLIAVMTNPLVLAAVLALRLVLSSRVVLVAALLATAGLHAVPELAATASPLRWSVVLACNLVGVGLLSLGFGWCIAAVAAARRMIGTLLGRQG